MGSKLVSKTYRFLLHKLIPDSDQPSLPAVVDKKIVVKSRVMINKRKAEAKAEEEIAEYKKEHHKGKFSISSLYWELKCGKKIVSNGNA